MNRSYIFLLIICLGLTQVFAQDQRNYAKLIQKEFVNDNSAIEITYKVPPGYTYYVSLETGDDNFLATNVRGLGDQVGSAYMSLTWYFSDDGFERSQIEPLKLRVVALRIAGSGTPTQDNDKIDNPRPSSGKGASIAGLGLIGLGAASGVYGYTLYGQTMDLYEVYEMNLNPDVSPYTEAFTREDHFTQANDKYRQAQILWYAGGGLALIGGIIMVASGRKNANASRVQLHPWEHIAQVQIPDPPQPLGLGMKIRF